MHLILRKNFVQAEKIYKHMEGITVFNLWKAYQSKFKVFSKSNEFNEDSSEKIMLLINYFVGE